MYGLAEVTGPKQILIDFAFGPVAIVTDYLNQVSFLSGIARIGSWIPNFSHNDKVPAWATDVKGS